LDDSLNYVAKAGKKKARRKKLKELRRLKELNLKDPLLGEPAPRQRGVWGGFEEGKGEWGTGRSKVLL
jgi:hypothetical protein